MDVLKKLFEQHFHSPPARIQPVQGDLGGSGRKIIRLANEQVSAIGILYGVREENAAFLEFSRHFRKHGLPVPEIYAEDLNHGAYLEEDLGDTTLFEFLSQNRDGANIAAPVLEVYRKVVAVLPRFQVEAGRDLDYSASYPCASFDRQSIAWDLNYFKYYFLRTAGVAFQRTAPRERFQPSYRFPLQCAPRLFPLPRFPVPQRNAAQRPAFLRGLSGWPQRRTAIRHRFSVVRCQGRSAAGTPPATPGCVSRPAVREFLDLDRDAFLHFYYAYVYVRLLQALGAYGFRGFYERKTHFLQSVPYALKNLRWLLHNTKLPIELPTLMEAFQGMLASEKLSGLASEAQNLVVRIFSFSFHHGLPQDETGNGGGFVFDGRSLPNPGREERFKTLTGKDAPVIEYLNQQESVHQFLAGVLSLVDASVSNYQQRGFKNLMVSFGCTGGQHRSVFLAEQLAKRLRIRNGLEVVVRHLELEKFGQ